MATPRCSCAATRWKRRGRGPSRFCRTGRLTNWGNMLTFGRNRHVFAVSNHVRSSMKYPAALAGRRMPPVETLYHGIDPSSIEAWASQNGVRQELGIEVGSMP